MGYIFKFVIGKKETPVTKKDQILELSIYLELCLLIVIQNLQKFLSKELFVLSKNVEGNVCKLQKDVYFQILRSLSSHHTRGETLQAYNRNNEKKKKKEQFPELCSL